MIMAFRYICPFVHTDKRKNKFSDYNSFIAFATESKGKWEDLKRKGELEWNMTIRIKAMGYGNRWVKCFLRLSYYQGFTKLIHSYGSHTTMHVHLSYANYMNVCVLWILAYYTNLLCFYLICSWKHIQINWVAENHSASENNNNTTEKCKLTFCFNKNGNEKSKCWPTKLNIKPKKRMQTISFSESSVASLSKSFFCVYAFKWIKYFTATQFRQSKTIRS